MNRYPNGTTNVTATLTCGNIPYLNPVGESPSVKLDSQFYDRVEKALARRDDLRSMADNMAQALGKTASDMFKQVTPRASIDHHAMLDVDGVPSRRRSSVLDAGGLNQDGELGVPSAHVTPREALGRALTPTNDGHRSQLASPRPNESGGTSVLNSPDLGSPSVRSPTPKALGPISLGPAFVQQGASVEGPQVEGFVALDAVDRKLIKNSIIALRALLSADMPDVGAIPLLLVDDSEGAAVLMETPLVHEQLVEVQLHSQEAANVMHSIAISMNLTFGGTKQRPPLRLFQRDTGTGTAGQGGSTAKARQQRQNAGPPASSPVLLATNASHLMPVLFPMNSEVTFDEMIRCRFRPEFVRLYHEPLCSTALYADCAMGSSENAKLTLMKAFIHLANNVIPAVARSIDAEPEGLYGEALCERLHMYGVNLCFMGWLIPWLQTGDAKQAVLTEIIARSYKHIPLDQLDTDGEEGEEGTDFGTLTRIAMNRFFPPHMHHPLPTFHPSSAETLRRLHPRYGIDVETLEVLPADTPCHPGVDLFIDRKSLATSLPPTPDYSSMYEYDSIILPSMVDGQKLEERIVQLCHVAHKLRGLPGKIENLARQRCLQLASTPLQRYFNFLQNALLQRSETVGRRSARLMPLLRTLAEVCCVLYPFEVFSESDQAAPLYLAQAMEIATGVEQVYNRVIPGLSEIRPADLDDALADTLLYESLVMLTLGEVEDAEESCNLALQKVRNPRLRLRIMMALADIVRNTGDNDVEQQLTTQMGSAVQKLLPAEHTLRQYLVGTANRTMKSRNQGLGASAELRGSQTAGAGERRTFASHGVAPATLRALEAHWDELLVEHRHEVFVPNSTTRVVVDAVVTGGSTKSPRSGELKSPRSEAAIDDEEGDTANDSMSIVDGYLTGGIEMDANPLRKRNCLVLVGDASKTTILAEAVYRILHNLPLVAAMDGGDEGDATNRRMTKKESTLNRSRRRSSGGAGAGVSMQQPVCDMLPVYVNASKHAPMDGGMLQRALAPLDAQAIEDLALNPRVVLFVDGIGEGPRGLPAMATTSGVLNWAGRTVITVHSRLVAQFTAAQMYQRLFHPSALGQSGTVDASMKSGDLTSSPSFRFQKSPERKMSSLARRMSTLSVSSGDSDDVAPASSFVAFSLKRKLSNAGSEDDSPFWGSSSTTKYPRGSMSFADVALPPSLAAASSGPRKSMASFASFRKRRGTVMLNESNANLAMSQRNNNTSQYTPTTVEIRRLRPYSDLHLRSVVVRYAAVDPLNTGLSVYWQHCLRHRLPRHYKLMTEPWVAHQTMEVLPWVLRHAESKTGWVCSADIFDAIIHQSFLPREPDQRRRNAAMQYAIGLAVRLYLESKNDIPHPAAAEFAHCLPINYNSSTTVVKFVHPVVQSYFLHLKLFLEVLEPKRHVSLGIIAPDEVAPAPSQSFSSPEAENLLTPLVEKQRQDATKKTEANLKQAGLKGFGVSVVPAQASVMKAVTKIKQQSRGITGGEWLATRWVSTLSDAVARGLLCDRALTCPPFHEVLMRYVTDRRDHPVMTANAATILAGARISLSGKTLRGASLVQANLAGVQCCAADARGSTLHHAMLRGANFDHAELSFADFRGADLGAAVQMAHSGEAALTCARFVPGQSNKLVTGNERGTVTLWEVDSGEPLRRFAHGNPVAAISMSSDGLILATASGTSDARIKVWSLNGGKLLCVLEGHADRITGLALWGSETVIASSADWTVRLWSIKGFVDEEQQGGDLESTNSGSMTTPKTTPLITTAPVAVTKKLLDKPAVKPGMGGHKAISPKPRALAPLGKPAGGRPKAVTPTPHSTTKLSGNQQASPPRRSMSPPNKRGAMAASVAITTDARDRRGVWAKPTFARQRGDPRGLSIIEPFKVICEHRSQVTACDFNPETNQIASMSADGTVNVTSATTGKRISSFVAHDCKGGAVLRFSPDGQRLAIPDVRGIALYNPEDGTLARVLGYPNEGTDVTSAIAFGPDGVLIAAAKDTSVVVWNAATQAVVTTMDGPHNARISAVDFNTAGTTLVSTSWDATLRVWPVSESVSSHHAPKIDDIPQEYKFLRLLNGTRHVICVTSNGQVDVRDTMTGSLLGSCANVDFDVTAAAGDDKSDLFAIAGPAVVFGSIFRRVPTRNLRTHQKNISGMTFLPRSSGDANVAPPCLLSVGVDRSFRIINADTGVILMSKTGDAPMLAANSGARALLVVSGFLSTKSVSMEVFNPRYYASEDGSGGNSAVSPSGAGLSSPEGSISARRRSTKVQVFATPDTKMLSVDRRKSENTPDSLKASSRSPSVVTSPSLAAAGSPMRSGSVVIRSTPGNSLRATRIMMLACQRAFRTNPELLTKHVVPFIRPVVALGAKMSVGPLRIQPKEGIMRCTIGVDDSVGVITIDRAVHVWDVKRRIQIRTGEVHSAVINAVDIVGDQLKTALLATASSDGTVLIAKVETGIRVVTLQPGLHRRMVGCRFVSAKAVLTCGSDLKTRRWNLEGTSCATGNTNDFARLCGAALESWLQEQGLGALIPAVGGRSADEFIGMDTAELRKHFSSSDPTGELTGQLSDALTEVRHESFQHQTGDALDDFTITADVFRQYAFEKAASTAEEFGLAPMALLILLTKTNGNALSQMNIAELRTLGNVNYFDLVQLLHDEMHFVRQKMRDTFAEMNVNDVSRWARTKHPMLRFALTVSGLTGTQLLDRTDFIYKSVIFCPDCKKIIPDPTLRCTETGEDHGGVVPTLTHETQQNISTLSNRLEERHHAMVDAMNSRLKLLPSSSFSCGMHWYPMVHDPGSISVATFSIPEMLSSPDTLRMNSAKLRLYATEMSLPRFVAVVEDGSDSASLRWLGGLRQAIDRYSAPKGYPEVILPPRWQRVQVRDNTVQYRCGSHIQQSHPSAPKAGSLRIGQHTTVATMEIDPSVKPEFGEEGMSSIAHPEPQHFFTEVKPGVWEADVLDHVQAAVKRFTAAASAGSPGKRSSGPTELKRTQSIVASAAETTSKQLTNTTIRILLVAEEPPQGEFCHAKSRRPQLDVNFYHVDRLCGCKVQDNIEPQGSRSKKTRVAAQQQNPDRLLSPESGSASATPSMTPRVASPRKRKEATLQPTGSLLCDRFCNVLSPCQGHKCTFRTDACRKAPFLEWQSIETPHGSYSGVHIEHMRGLTSVNRHHILERQRIVDEEVAQHISSSLRSTTSGGQLDSGGRSRRNSSGAMQVETFSDVLSRMANKDTGVTPREVSKDSGLTSPASETRSFEATGR